MSEVTTLMIIQRCHSPDGLGDVEAVGVDPPGDGEPLLHVRLLVADPRPHLAAQLREGPLQLPRLAVDLLLDPLHILDHGVHTRPGIIVHFLINI